MKTVVLIAALLFSKSIYAQQDSLKYWDKDQPLQWADFIAPVNEESRFYAETFSGMHYSYSWHSDGTVRTFNFKVNSVMNKGKSWSVVEKQSTEILKHEQLHFDISEYFARQLLITLNQYKYTEDYQKEIKNLYSSMETERSTMETIYDLLTNHSLNKKVQAKWEAFITDILIHDFPLNDVLTKELSIK